MRQLLLAAGAMSAAIGLAGRADAQGTAMPGQVVGSGYSLPPVGNAIPKAAPPAGIPIGSPFSNAAPANYDPFKGTGLDSNALSTPLPNLAGSQTNDQNTLRRMYEKLKVVVGISSPDIAPSPFAPRTGYTPGISRRNRERAEERMWRRD